MDIFLYSAVNKDGTGGEPGIITGEMYPFKGLLKMSQFFTSEGIELPAYEDLLGHFKKSDVMTLEIALVVHYIRKLKISD